MKFNVTLKIDTPFDGADLRRWREERGIGLREFCGVLEVTSSYWSKVERGLAMPDFETCIRAVTLILDYPGRIAK